MRIELKQRRVSVDQALREQVERCLHFALGRFSAHIARVVVRFDDINGPRGGVDTAVMLDVRLKPSGRILIREVDTSVASVIDAAAQRAGRAVGREMRMKRDLHETRWRRSPRRAASDAQLTASHTRSADFTTAVQSDAPSPPERSA